ncbi:hypothetical protein [Aquibium oceanicum]|nr:hypothetical protein [Aquibium oceanicum]
MGELSGFAAAATEESCAKAKLDIVKAPTANAAATAPLVSLDDRIKVTS